MKSPKKYRFFYHYNKFEDKMTIHYRKKCHIVKDIACFTDVYSKWNKSQPKLVMQGWASDIVITNDMAIIT